MDKINFQNGVTKVNADTFNTFQNNIENSINALQSNVNDMISTLGIEEEKTVNGIHYIKYKNGKLIQYGNWEDTMNATTLYYNIGYRTDEYAFGGKTYPVAFKRLDNIQISSVPKQDNILIATIFKNDNELKTLPKMHYIFPYKDYNVKVKNNFFAIGTWK